MPEHTPHDPGPASTHTSCLERLAELARNAAPRQPCAVRLRRDQNTLADAVLYMNRGHGPSRQSEGEFLLATLSEVGWIARVKPRPGAFELTFSDDFIAEWADRLVGGEMTALSGSSSLSSRRSAVQFLDANLTKALHLGHLRNASLGEAMASMLEAAGAWVTRRAWYTDAGRSSFEALAGVIARNPALEPPETKPDHYVGSCYVDYVDGVRGRNSAPVRSPIDRELRRFDDAAEDLMQRWLAGDEVVREAWLRVRDWVVAGQRATLRRIGMRIDECLYQSDCLVDLDHLIAAGLEKRLLDRKSGEIVYRRHGAGHERMTLVRDDGFPTEYARMIAMIWRDQPIASEYDFAISVSGAEWQHVGDPFRELLTKLGPCPLYDKVDLIYHGMCTVEGSKMDSHSGGAVLIDDLLDRLGDDPRLRKAAGRCGSSCSRDTLAGIVARLYLLARNPREVAEFSWDNLLSEKRNPGWVVCRVFCRTHGAEREGDGGGGASTDANCRLMVARAHEYPSRLQASIKNRDPRPLIASLIGICETYEEVPPSAELTRITRTLVDCLLRALGLFPRPLQLL